jgi:hypothetical protein
VSTDTKTIHEFLAENPNVDVSHAWKRCWGILSGVIDRVQTRLPAVRHPSCNGREYYTSPDEQWEGSFNAYTGNGAEWLVHSWLGSRKNSILDMNATVFLGQETRVPHMILVFGTIPKMFFYCDYTPRVNLRTNPDYLDKYYGDEVNKSWLQLRGDPRFTWSVSHGTYMRSLLSPVALSMTAELEDPIIDTLEAYVNRFVNRWLGWLDEAEPVPEPERAALRREDHLVRELGYRRDPMNALAANVFGANEVEKMVNWRMGSEQMQETE